MHSHQASRTRLEQFVEAEHESLLKTLRYYVLRGGLASGAGIEQVANELFSEVMVEALAHVERLKPEIQPRPWLLGIAANLIKRRQVELTKRDQREPLARDLYPRTQDALSDEEIFDQLPVINDKSLEELEADEFIRTMLIGVSKSDADLLRLAIVHDLDGESLAKELGISPGAARVRLHRALQRLRNAQQAGQRNSVDE